MVAPQIGESRSKMVRNTVFLAVNNIGGTALTLVQLAVLSRYLGTGEFGLFVTLRGFSLLLATIMLFGLPNVLVRFIPSYESRGERSRAAALFARSVVVVLALGAMLFATRGGWSAWMPSGIRESAPTNELILWMALSAVALALKMLLFGAFNGLREMRAQTALELSYLALFTAYIVVNRSALDVTSLFTAMCACNAIAFAAGVPVFAVLTRRLIPGARPPRAAGVRLPALPTYWAGSVLLSIVALAFTDVDRFVMSSMVPVAAISVFHVASRIHGLLKKFLGLPLIAAQPEVTRIYEEGRMHELLGKVRLFTKGTVVAAFFVAAIVVVSGRDAVTILSGPQYGDAYGILVVLVCAIPVAAVAAPLLTTMRALHYMKWAVVCDAVWMAVYFGSFFALVSTLGVMGMAVAHLLAAAGQMLVAISIAKREGFFGGIGSRIGGVAAVLAAGAVAGAVVTAKLGVEASLACIIVSPVIAKFVLHRLGVFDESERERIVDLVPTALGKRGAVWMLSGD
jgi:O-antigen/teichoic acid export membrane protein